MVMISSNLETLTLQIVVLDYFSTGFINKFFSDGINL